MEEVKLTKEQEILFEVYDKGVQNEDCDLDAYVEKMKQALSIGDVSSMFSAKQMEQAFNDGVEAEQQRCGEFNIENYC